MNQATNSLATVTSTTTTTTTATIKTYKCDTCNLTYSDKMYYDLHKQNHHKEFPLVQIVMNPSTPQVITQPAPAHQGASQIVIPDDQLVAYKRAYGIEPQQVYTLAPVTQYQVITTNNRAGTVSLSQAGQNAVNIPTYSAPAYVVATADGHQIHALQESIIQHDHPHQQQAQPQQQQLSHDNQHHHHNQADQQTQLIHLQQHQQQQHQQHQQQQQQHHQQEQQQQLHIPANTRMARGVVITQKDRPFKCDQCTASFIESGELEEHKKKHTGDGPFTCEDCHFTFMYKSHFKSHKSRCQKRRATMPNPPKPIVNPSPVKRQFPTNHINQGTQKQIQNCQIQQSQTSYQQIKIAQVITKLNGPNVNQKTNATSRQVTKQTIQNKFNPSNPSFKRVKKESRLDRPYECDECDASFQTEVDLKAHKEKHTGDGPFKCEECRFVFLYRKLYDVHRRRCEKKRLVELVAMNSNAEVATDTSISHSSSPAVTSMVVAPQVGQVQQLQPQQQQEIHIQTGQGMATAVPASLATTMLSGNLQMHSVNVSGQPSVIEMRPVNSQTQDIQQQIQLSHTPIIEQVLVSPGNVVSSIGGGRQDIKYEVIPVTAGIVDVSDGVNVNQIMNLIKVKGPNQ